MAAPTFVSSGNSAYGSTSTPKTASVTTQAGDIVIVYGAAESNAVSLGTPTGNSISFALQTSTGATGNYGPTYIWSGTDSAGGAGWTLSMSRSGTSAQWGFGYLVFRSSDGLGATDSIGSATSNLHPYLSLTSTQANSAIVTFLNDWDATSGGSRTWQTVNSITPTSGNGYETTYSYQNGAYTVYGAYYPDVGSTGSKTVGLSNLDNSNYCVVALEIKGSAGATNTSPLPWLAF